MAYIENYARYPVEFERGEGAWLWATGDGTPYLDALTGIAVCSTGHCHPRVVEAIRDQAGRLLHVSNLFTTAPNVALAQRLVDGSLRGGAALFQNSGAEANEAAIKLARKAKQGGTIVSVHGGFHGRTYGALSATPQESKQAPFAPIVPGFVAVAPSVEAIRSVVDDGTAAVVLEVVQGESGVHPLPDDVLVAAREACDRHRACLVLDEVQTGCGRTGTLWAYEQTPIVPDVLTTAKALGGGLPIGALVAGPGWADVLQPGDHGSTFAGGPLQSAAALAALDVLEDPALLASVREVGERLLHAVADLPEVTAVRGRGLMVGADVSVSAPDAVRRALLEHRLVANATGPSTIRLLPPLTLSAEEADEVVARLGAALAAG